MTWFDPRLDPPSAPLPLWRRLGWLAVYWAASVGALAVVAFGLRAWVG